MAKLTLQLMKERTMNALAAHTDPKTVTAIGEVLGYGNIAALLKIHRQVPDEVIHRWIFRDALKKNEYRDIEIAIFSAWQRCLDAKLIPMMVLSSTTLMKKVNAHLAEQAALPQSS